MTLSSQSAQPVWPVLAWVCAALLGLVVPVAAVFVAGKPSALPAIIALALMSAGMIAASLVGRLLVGMGGALATALVLFGFAGVLGVNPFDVALAAFLASLSFAARGTLFANSAGPYGWLVALGIVAGEGAVVLSAMIQPGVWPDWLLALLPAQWASMAIEAALGGSTAIAPLTALGGTALATLLVVQLWPRRWTYGIMFSVWLGLSAFVYHSAY